MVLYSDDYKIWVEDTTQCVTRDRIQEFIDGTADAESPTPTPVLHPTHIPATSNITPTLNIKPTLTPMPTGDGIIGWIKDNILLILVLIIGPGIVLRIIDSVRKRRR